MTDQEVRLFLADLPAGAIAVAAAADSSGDAYRPSWRAPGRPLATWTSGSRTWTGAGSWGSVDPDEAAARDLQRSPVVCRLPGEDTGAEAVFSGTPGRGWPNGRAGHAKAGRSGPGH